MITQTLPTSMKIHIRLSGQDKLREHWRKYFFILTCDETNTHHDVRFLCHPSITRAHKQHESANRYGDRRTDARAHEQYGTALCSAEDPGRGASVACEEETQCAQVVRSQNSDGGAEEFGAPPFQTVRIQKEDAHDRSSVDAVKTFVAALSCQKMHSHRVPTKGIN